MDADKIKDFFLFHFEKMVLVLVIGASGFLIYKGMELPNFLETEQPDRLTENATRVKAEIDENHNDQIIPERKPTFDILAETKKVYTAVDNRHYGVVPWDPSKRTLSIVRRKDPGLVSPRAVRAVGVSTAIAVRGSTSANDAYFLASLEEADAVERVEQKVVRQPRRSVRRRGGGGGGMEMDMGMDDMMEEMDMEMDMEDMGMEEMGASMGGTRKFDGRFDFGMRPMTTEDKRNPEPAVGWFIAGTAVVPHKDLYRSFEQALRDADKYSPGRDTPFYFNLEIQRADVTDKGVDELAEEDWTKSVQTRNKQALWDRELLTKLAAFRWSGFAPEIVPADYRDEALSGWIPPVLLDDYDWFALHPLVPMLSKDELKKLENSGEEVVNIIEFDPLGMDNVGLLNPGQRAGAGVGMGGGMDMMDMEMDMEMDMGDMGGMGGMMMGMGRAMMSRGIDTDPVEYKLIRFYDFFGFPNSPKPGRQYVYRLRYSVVDPNFPFSQMLQPQANTLAPEVILRVQDLMAEAKSTGKRSFQRWSDWSEPSEPVSLPTLEHYYAGSVNRGTINTWKVRGKDVPYARDIPKGKIIASQYDLSTGARIPMHLDVIEGTVLSHKAEFADVVDPITLLVKKLPEAELLSGTTIVDLGGGAPLKIVDELTEPGLMLLYDQSGKLTVTDEVSDQEYYRIYSYADARGE